MVGTKEELKRKRYDDFYFDLAERVAKMSYARRLQVGSVLVKNGNIISFGWNGMPAGFENECEEIIPEHHDVESRTITPEMLVTKPFVIHSEINCLLKVARSHDSCLDATMYITHAPCVECSKAILQAGVAKVRYAAEYRRTDGIDLLRRAGVVVEKKPL